MVDQLIKLDSLHKIFTNWEEFKSFEDSYPFLTVSDESSSFYHLRAEARYPSDLGKGLFIGNFVNSTNSYHFECLKIKQIIGLTPQNDEKLAKLSEASGI